MKQHILFGTGLCLLGLSQAGHGAGVTGVDVQFINDSNPAKAEFDRDIEETNSVKGRVTGNLWSRSLGDSDLASSGVSLNGVAAYEHNLDIQELGESLYRISADVFLERKQQRGRPFYRASLGLGYIDAESFIRDGPQIDIGASINFQPTDFFDTTVGINVGVRNAETDVFDTTKTQFFMTSNFSPIARVVFRAGLRYVIGDEVSTATPTLNIVNNANAIEPDDAFGGVEANRFAYLIDANSAIAEIGAGYEFTTTVQGNLLYRFISTEADGGIGYDRSMLELTVSFDL